LAEAIASDTKYKEHIIMRYRTSVTFAFALISLPLLMGCTTIHKVNASAIETNRSKIFMLGMVKVSGGSAIGLGDRVDVKKKVLEKMPVEEICSVLTSNYGFKIDTQVDKTVKTVKEPLEGQGRAGPPPAGLSVQIYILSENPYWGKKEYRQVGFLKGIFAGEPKIQDENEGDMVYITYKFRSGGLPWALKEIFSYDVLVKSGSTVLLHYAGPVATIDMPKKGLIIDFDGYWNEMICHVDKIPEVFAKDLKTRK
jgi:hypothetical protein